MEDQPTQSSGASPDLNNNLNQDQPIMPESSEPQAAPEPLAPDIPTENTDKIDNTDNKDVILEAGKRKRKKSLIITLVCLFAVLLIGGGAFAAVYLINNQPERILASSINHFLNAKQIAINGSFDLSFNEGTNNGIESINLKFDDKSAGLTNSTTATIDVNLTNGLDIPPIELGEVLLDNGVIYIEANGLEDFYNDGLRDTLETMLMNQLVYGYSTTTVSDCLAYDEGAECIEESTVTPNIDPAVEAQARQVIGNILDQVGEIITSIDNQWIEISIDDMMEHELFASMPEDSRKAISDNYKCTINTLNKLPNYSNELLDLYSKNSFINMTSGSDSFYNINFDTTKLAGFLNSIPNATIIKDLSKCSGTDYESTESKLDTETLEEYMEYLPSISAKFGGFIEHYLSELRITESNEAYSLKSDLKFDYPNNVDVKAPTDSRPIMDVVEEVYQKIQSISNSLVGA